MKSRSGGASDGIRLDVRGASAVDEQDATHPPEEVGVLEGELVAPREARRRSRWRIEGVDEGPAEAVVLPSALPIP